MDNNLKLEISQKLSSLKAEYTNGGKFAQADLQKDLDNLNELVLMEVMDRLFQLKPPAQMLSSEKEVEVYIDSSFTKDELQSVIYSASDEIFSGWLSSMGVKDN